MLPLNDPAVLAELTALHDAYERALVANDVSSLHASFWNSPHVVRFGASEQLYGAEEIAAYRNESPPVLLNRHITRRVITTFGDATAIVMSEMTQTVAGEPRRSRQSQVWIRFPDMGWKIVSAHVSHAPVHAIASAHETFVDRAAAAINLPLAPAHRPGVVRNFERAAVLAHTLLEFELPNEVELAPVFSP